MTPPATSTLSPEAEELFARFAAQERDKPAEPGPAAEFERLLEQHPEHARDLRRLYSSWRWVNQLFAGWDANPSALISATRELAQRGLELDQQTREQLERLARARPSSERFQDPQKLAAGGMGIVYRVHDQELERELAMKVLSDPPQPSEVRAGNVHTTRDGQRLRRFLAEARLTARLDHPGIVPVHELGVDEQGRPFFTMRFVRGSSLADVLRFAREGQSGWTQMRVLEVLLKVCDAVAYAHSQGVIHRDLKPANIMVGEFGETYVMDWGLAHAVDGAEAESSSAAADEDAAQGGNLTQDGDILGTPAYMPPEQAASRHEQIGPHSDVYAVGAILYQLLAGSAPYMSDSVLRSSKQVVELLLERAPDPLELVAPAAPPELAAICAKAMAREIPARYPDMGAMAADLRAFMEGRVVRAHEQGRSAELKKWILRNRALAGISAGAVVVVILALLLVLGREADRARRAQMEADLRGPAALRAQADELWPATPALLPKLRAWLTQAQTLVGRGQQYEQRLARLEARALPPTPGDRGELAERERVNMLLGQQKRELQARRAEILALDRAQKDTGTQIRAEVLDDESKRIQAEILRLEALLEAPLVRHFEDPADEELYASLQQFESDLHEFNDPDARFGALQSVRERIEHAETLAARAASERSDAWNEAIRSIADESVCPLYRGLLIGPQADLVPLRRNEQGLWEFAHRASGPAPDLRSGALDFRADSGMVLVLLPGGIVTLGSKPALHLAADAQHAPPPWKLDDTPLVSVSLAPFFISKFEVTQAQWWYVMRETPSEFKVGHKRGGEVPSAKSPVEMVSWNECVRMVRRAGLALPSEAQWEYAARGGTKTPWWTGADAASLEEHVHGNLLGERASPADSQAVERHPLDVDTLAANPFGLFHVLGNVSEWTSDPYWPDYGWVLRPGDGAQLAGNSGLCSYRGGSLNSTPPELRGSQRAALPPDNKMRDLGLRPVRALDP